MFVVRSSARAMLGNAALAVALCVALGPAPPSEAQEPGFTDWVGALAPRGVASLDAALASGRVVVLHFTGDAGADNIAQTITLNRTRERYGNDVVFLRAENETTEGDKVFDAFGAARIPSLIVVDTAGVVTLARDVSVGETELAAAIDEARKHGPPLRREQPSVYELDSPLPSPTRLRGQRAPASTPELAAALEAPAQVVVAFTGAFSRYDAEQEEALARVEADLGAAVTVVRVRATDGANEPAFHEYSVTGVPALFVIRDQVVAEVLNGLTSLEALVSALEAGPAEPPPPSDDPGGSAPVGAEETPIEPPRPENGAANAGEASPEGPDEPPGPGVEATEGVEGNLLSPAEGATLTVASAVNEDYGPNRLVDGLLPEDEGFLPWVSAAASAPPLDIRATFAAPREVSGLEVSVATGDPVLFGSRWPTAVEVLYWVPGETEAREWAVVDVDADGSAVRLEIEPTVMASLMIRILGIRGGGRTCELAEIGAW